MALPAADPIQYRYSTGNRFAIYVQPLTDSAGAEVGGHHAQLRRYSYWGNTDSAYLQVIGCHQVWT